MSFVTTVLPYAQIILSILVVSGVLLQYSSAGAGGAFGSADSFDSAAHTRRGFERFLFIGTIVMIILFAVSCILAFAL